MKPKAYIAAREVLQLTPDYLQSPAALAHRLRRATITHRTGTPVASAQRTKARLQV